MENNPLVSVIVPVYNAEKYVAFCIESILNQSYKELELLLINDGSTDNSLSVIKKYQKDSRVKLISIHNEGVSNARNLGISKSIGEYIMFIDSDDYIEKQTLEDCVRHIKKNDCDLLFFCWSKEKEYKKVKVTQLEKNSYNIINNNINWLRKRTVGPSNVDLNDGTPIDLYNTPWAKLYKAKVLKDSKVKFKPRNIVGMEDVLFNIEIFQHVKSVTFLNQYLYNYRVDSEGSLTKTDVDKMDYKLKTLIKEIELSIQEDNLKENLSNRIKFSMINILASLTSKHRKTNFRSKYREVKKVVNDPFYHNVFKEDFSGAAFKLKTFFLMCKFKQAFILTLILSFLSRIK